MKHDLIDRYIYAVTKRLPIKTREDIERELRTLIDDMLEARCGEALPGEQDVRAVLSELGTPADLSHKYHPNEKSLIGPALYGNYCFVLAVVLIAMAGGITLAKILEAAAAAGDAYNLTAGAHLWPEFFASWLTSLFSGALSAFAIVTIIFAIIERKDVSIDFKNDSLDTLPPVPEKRARIPRGESIIGIVFGVLFTVSFLVAPQIFGIFWIKGIDGYLPIFNSEYLSSVWYLTVLIGVCGVLRECVNLYEGRYTKRVALTTCVTNLCTMAASYLLLSNDEIINVRFLAALPELVPIESETVHLIAMRFNMLILCVICFALVLNAGITLFRVGRYNRENKNV